MLRRVIFFLACLVIVNTPLLAAPDPALITPEHSPAPPFTLPDLSGRAVKLRRDLVHELHERAEES